MQDTTSGNESTKTIPSNSPFFFQSEVEPHFHLYLNGNTERFQDRIQNRRTEREFHAVLNPVSEAAPCWKLRRACGRFAPPNVPTVRL